MDVTGRYHKAIVAGVASGILAALAIITGAMGPVDTFGDIPTLTWLEALAAFIVGSGITGGAVAASRANAPAPEDSPRQAGSGAAPSTEHPSARPGAAPSLPNPHAQKG